MEAMMAALSKGQDSGADPAAAAVQMQLEAMMQMLTGSGSGGSSEAASADPWGQLMNMMKQNTDGYKSGDSGGGSSGGSWSSGKGSGKSSGKVKKKMAVCTYWEQGRCNKGSDCTFAHGEHEIGMPQTYQGVVIEQEVLDNWKAKEPTMTGTETTWEGNIEYGTCSSHKRKRSMNNLIDDGNNGFCCAPGCECHVGDMGDTATCSLHGRKRTIKNLMDDGAGGMKCTPGFECRGGPPGTGDWSSGNETDICSVHGTKRTVRNLIDDGSGGKKCAPGYECQTTYEKGEGKKGGGGKWGDNDGGKGAFTTWGLGSGGKGKGGGGALKISLGMNWGGMKGGWNDGGGGGKSGGNESGGDVGGKGMKPGDWICPGCGDHQFARNTTCRQCQTPNPNAWSSPY